MWIPRCAKPPHPKGWAKTRPRAGMLQRSLSPQPAWGWEGTARQRNHLHRAECCFVSYLLQTTPPALQTEHQKRRQQTTSQPLPWDCIDRGGSSLQREVHLGCDFPAGFYSQQHWERRELRVQFSDQVLAGSSEHSEKSIRGRLAVSAPSSLIVWAAGTPSLGGVTNSLEAPNGDGVDGEQRQCLPLENQKCLGDVHAASWHLP